MLYTVKTVNSFFDPEYKNKMTNLEVEALLLRGALVDMDDKYYRPSSFNENDISFSNAISNTTSFYKNFLDYSEYVNDNDWTEAFNKMALEIGVDYHSLFIPNGSYEITERIIFENKDNITILSDFAEIKNIVQDAANAKGGTFYFRNCKNVHIEGVKHIGIDDTYPLQSINYGHHGMMLHGCTNISIVRNHFYNFADNALLLAQDSNNDTEKIAHGKNIWVKDCYFNNIWQTSTTTMGANNVYYVNNIFEKLAGSCKFAQRYDLGGNLFILGNRITGVKKNETTSTSYSHGFELNNYRNVIIKDNIIDGVGGQGVFISNNTRSEDANRYVLTGEITIENNKISNFDTGGIYLYNPTVTIGSTVIKEKMSNIYIRNNSFNNIAKSTSSTIQCSGNQLTDIYIENNFSNNPDVAFFNYTCDPILNTDSTYKYPNSRIYIRGNTILGSSNGINLLKYIKGLVVQNNYIESTTYCISTSIYCEDYVIKNNTLSMIGTAGNCINGQGELNRAIIEGNIIDTQNLGCNLVLTDSNWIKFINNTFINPNAFGIRLANQSGIIYHLGNIFTNVNKKLNNTGTTQVLSIVSENI